MYLEVLYEFPVDKVQFHNEFQLYYILYQEGAIHNISKVTDKTLILRIMYFM